MWILSFLISIGFQWCLLHQTIIQPFCCKTWCVCLYLNIPPNSSQLTGMKMTAFMATYYSSTSYTPTKILTDKNKCILPEPYPPRISLFILPQSSDKPNLKKHPSSLSNKHNRPSLNPTTQHPHTIQYSSICNIIHRASPQLI